MGLNANKIGKEWTFSKTYQQNGYQKYTMSAIGPKTDYFFVKINAYCLYTFFGFVTKDYSRSSSNFNNTNIKSSYFVGTHGDVCTKGTKTTELKELSDDLINKSFWYQGKPSSSGKNPHEAEGSIYGFVFDREKKTISVSFNNKYIHVFNKVNDEEYYPCIDFYYQLAEVEFCKPVTDIKNTMVSDTLKSIGKKAEKVPLIGALNFYKNKVTNITGGIVNSLSKDNKEELKKESEN